MNLVIHADNLSVLKVLPDNSIDLIYIDPPFNTGKKQTRYRIKTERSETGNRVGFGGRKYITHKLLTSSFNDCFDDYSGFLEPRLIETLRILKPTGSFYFHGNYREIHYVKVMLDGIFGRKNFINEVIWAYDYGARSKKRWSAKHDTILLYAKDRKKFYYDYASIERIPYLAPSLVGPEKAARGKTLTDCIFKTIVPTNSREKTGFCTQKPLSLINQFVRVSCPPGGMVLDYFAGSGTTGESAVNNGRQFMLVDCSTEAMIVMRKRFEYRDDVVKFFDLDNWLATVQNCHIGY